MQEKKCLAGELLDFDNSSSAMIQARCKLKLSTSNMFFMPHMLIHMRLLNIRGIVFLLKMVLTLILEKLLLMILLKVFN